jgi:hypothetical protein
MRLHIINALRTRCPQSSMTGFAGSGYAGPIFTQKPDLFVNPRTARMPVRSRPHSAPRRRDRCRSHANRPVAQRKAMSWQQSFASKAVRTVRNIRTSFGCTQSRIRIVTTFYQKFRPFRTPDRQFRTRCRRDRMTEASGQKPHWKHRLAGVSSVLMPPDANRPHGALSHAGNQMRVTAGLAITRKERRPGTNSNELNTA